MLICGMCGLKNANESFYPLLAVQKKKLGKAFLKVTYFSANKARLSNDLQIFPKKITLEHLSPAPFFQKGD